MPPTPERNAYDVLGLPRTASLEEIKKRYRELARKYHPDVNQNNPAAGKVFSEVTTAYKTLSDANSRATYDAEMALRDRQASQAAARAAAGSRTAPGRTAANTAPRATTPPPTASTAATQALNESQRLSESAQAAFQRGKFVEARSLAEQALRKNRRNALGYEVLGDVYRLQGKSDEALNMYTVALQLSPHNGSLRMRFERMARAVNAQPRPAPERSTYSNRDDNGPPPSVTSSSPSARPTSYDPRDKRSLALLLVGFFGYAGVFILFLYACMEPGRVPGGTPILTVVSSWNATILTLLGLSGAMLGATMTITGAIRRIDDELILSGVGGRGVSYIPMGLLIVVLSVLNFYLAAAVYTALALVQESFTRTMQRVFAAIILVTALFAFAYEPGHFQVALWGGNVVFLTFVIGWLLGDVFRPDSAV